MIDGHTPLRSRTTPADPASRVYWGLLAVLQTVMFAELAALIAGRQWMNAVLVSAIMAMTLAPVVLRSWMPIRIPPEFQILAVGFVFASLFLGEVRSYYEIIWWWDVGLHASSGLLLGVVGFLLVYVLNENERIDISLRPRFLALFAFVFAIAVGSLWEVFEYAMDQLLGLEMQKARFGDPSGLSDTMLDLIFDALGALLISWFGWWYMVHGQRSFVEGWIGKFNARNQHLFRSRRAAGTGASEREP